jgi:hypothetical protein
LTKFYNRHIQLFILFQEMAKENAFLARFKIKGGFKKLDFNGLSLIRTHIIYEIFNNIKISNILVFCNFYITKNFENFECSNYET